MRTFITEPERRTPVIAETDILVIGGGSAGLAAAVAASRAGARAMLVERYGSLGGLATNGLIILLLTLALGLFTVILSGYFSGRRARMGAALLGLLLVVDLAPGAQIQLPTATDPNVLGTGTIPEPGAGGLVALGLALLSGQRIRSRRPSAQAR